MSEAIKVTSRDITNALRVYYPDGAWAIAFEVGNATGFSCQRHADAVAMSLWPSRGLEFHGIEIKVSKTDFKKELEQPEKADAIARYCDLWWVAAPKGLLDPSSLPIAWGLLELNGNGLKVKKQAQRLDPLPVDRKFCAALFRAVLKEDACRLNEAVRKHTEGIEKRVTDNAVRAVEYREKQLQERAEELRRIEKETGIPISSMQWRTTGFIEAVNKVMSHREPATWRVRDMVAAAEKFADELNEMLDAETNPETPD